MTIGIVLGAAANGALALWASSLEAGLLLRFATGVCLAGAYPPAMKIMATWFREGRGLAIGHPRRRPHRRLGDPASHPGADRASVARNPAHRVRARPRRCGRRPALRRRGPSPLPGGPLRHADGRRDLRRARTAAGLLRLPRPHVGALRDVGVDRRLPSGEPRGARRRPLRRAQPERRHVRRSSRSARSAAGRAASPPIGGAARRSR